MWFLQFYPETSGRRRYNHTISRRRNNHQIFSSKKIPFPKKDRLFEIVTNRLGLYSAGNKFVEDALSLFFQLRNSDLRKKPATAELLSWMVALQDMSDGAENPLAKSELALRTMNVLIKTAKDQNKAKEIVEKWIENRKQ